MCRLYYVYISYDKPRQHIKKQRHYFANRDLYSQSYGYSSSHVYGCESWTIKRAEHQRTDAFKLWCWRRLLRVMWTVRRSNQSSLKEINPEYSLEGLNAKTEAPILWPPDAKNWVIGKDPDAGKDWRQEEKGRTDDKMVGWHHQLNAHAFEQTPGDTEEQGSLVCCSPWGLKELDTTEQLNSKLLQTKQLYLHTILLRQEPIPLKFPQNTVSFTLWYLSPSLLTSPDLDPDFGFHFEGMGETLHALLWCKPCGTNAEAEIPILWPPDAKNWLIWKDPNAGKDWRQEEKGKTDDEMAGWHHWLNGHDFE